MADPPKDRPIARLTRRLAAAAVLALAAQAAFAAPPPTTQPPPPRLFLSPSGEPFRQGSDTPDPFEAWFAQADANHDGAIDRDEMRADAARFFRKVDANGDGVIDGMEVTAYEAKIVPELVAQIEGRYPAASPGDHRGQPDGGQGPRGGRGADRGGGARGGAPPQGVIARLLAEPEPVSGADFNFDGRISLAEWMLAADRRFELLDPARTGRLTHDALKARLAATKKGKR